MFNVVNQKEAGAAYCIHLRNDLRVLFKKPLTRRYLPFSKV